MRNVSKKGLAGKSKRAASMTSEGTQVLPLGVVVRGEMMAVVLAAGIERVHEMLEEDRTRLCGAAYSRPGTRTMARAGHSDGELVLGGRRVSISRPRVRSVGEGSQEVQLPTWEVFSKEDPLQERAVEQMTIGVSTRKYERSLEGIDAGANARGTKRSSVSRRFVIGTQKKVDELRRRSLQNVDPVVVMIDGIHFADHVVLVALGFDKEGCKHVLGLQEGATENASACRALLRNLVERGLNTSRPTLVVIDGAKALRRAVRDSWGDRALVQRCQEHKKRNVVDNVSDARKISVRQTMNQAYAMKDGEKARTMLKNLARSLRSEHPGAAESLEEGLDETLTILSLQLPATLMRSLATTNPIENLLGTVRHVSRRVKRWGGGAMVLRWAAAGLDEAARGFRRLRGYRGMPDLVRALENHDRAQLDLGDELAKEGKVA